MSPANVHVLGAPEDPGRVRWQVHASNGRILCRSADTFADDTSARTGLEGLLGRLPELTPSLTHPQTGLGWVWSLNDRSGTVLIVGARSYERRGTCVNACRHFLRSVPDLLPVVG